MFMKMLLKTYRGLVHIAAGAPFLGKTYLMNDTFYSCEKMVSNGGTCFHTKAILLSCKTIILSFSIRIRASFSSWKLFVL